MPRCHMIGSHWFLCGGCFAYSLGEPSCTTHTKTAKIRSQIVFQDIEATIYIIF
jgi:hypothetical protein